MKDWLGNEYGIGDLVIYAAMSGRSITMVQGRVVDIYYSYRDPDGYKLIRLTENEKPPFQRVWDHDKKGYVDTDERLETVLRVQIQPLKSSRWKQHYGKTRYIDKRTGKGIDPYRSDKHLVEWGYNIDTRTGKRINDRDYSRPLVPYEFREYVPTEFKDYVEEVHEEPKPVTITVTDNIVKWVGE